MTALALALLAAAAQADAAPVAFRLGELDASARHLLEDGRPMIEVRVENLSAAPLWWYGVYHGCTASQTVGIPKDADGNARPELVAEMVACGSGAKPTAAQLAEWRLEPGESRAVQLSPFWLTPDGRPRMEDPVPPLSEFAWATEITLPFAIPEGRPEDPECPFIVFAWRRNEPLRVFVERDGDVLHPNFDPFDATPFFREDPVPIRIGPLLGEARLEQRNGMPEVHWTVRNPTQRTTSWMPLTGSTTFQYGFLERGECACAVDVGSFFGVLAPPPAPLRPGESMSDRILPLRGPLMDGQSCDNPDHGPNASRWHYVQDCGWPVAAEDGDLSGPSAWLHVEWDERHGLSMGLAWDREGRNPRGWCGTAEGIGSAARRVGGGWVVASAPGGDPAAASLIVAPDWRATQWSEQAGPRGGEFRWVGGTSEPLRPARPTGGLPLPLEPRTWRIEEAVWTSSLGHWRFPSLEEPARHPVPVRGGRPAWEWARWIMVPQERTPKTTHDCDLLLASVSWDPERGLDLNVGSAEPR